MPFIPDQSQPTSRTPSRRGFIPDPQKSISQRRTEAKLAENEASKSFAGRFLKALPGQATKQLLQAPARFVSSAAQAVTDVPRQAYGLATNTPVQPSSAEIPFAGRSFQSEFAQNYPRLTESATPALEAYGGALKPFVDVPLAGLQAGGYAKGLIGDVGLTNNVGRVVSRQQLNPGEVKAGLLPKIPGKVAGVFERRAESRARDFALELTSEKMTPKVGEKALREGRTTPPGFFRSSKIIPGGHDHVVAESVQDVVKPGKKLTSNIDAIRMKVSQINNGVENMIADRKMPFNTNQLRSKLMEGNEDLKLIFASDSNAEKTYDAVVEAFMKQVAKKDTLGLFKARQSFDQVPAIRKLLETEGLGENVRREIVLAVRRSANEYVSSLLPANNPYRPLLTQESYMLEALGNIAEKNAKVIGKNNLQLITDRYPVLKWVIGGLAGAAGVGVGGAIIGSTD